MEYHFNLHLIGVAYCIWAENVNFTVKGHTVLQMKEEKKTLSECMKSFEMLWLKSL